jgi:hypothetical protein
LLSSSFKARRESEKIISVSINAPLNEDTCAHVNKVMNKIVLFLLCLLSLDPSSSSFNENYDDMLIQCNVYERSMPKVRDKHLCERDDNNDDDFLYYIAPLKATYSGKERIHIHTHNIDMITRNFLAKLLRSPRQGVSLCALQED